MGGAVLLLVTGSAGCSHTTRPSRPGKGCGAVLYKEGRDGGVGGGGDRVRATDRMCNDDAYSAACAFACAHIVGVTCYLLN